MLHKKISIKEHLQDYYKIHQSASSLFFQKAPALLYSLALLFAALFSYTPSFSIIISFCLLILSVPKRQKILFFLLFLSSFSYFSQSHINKIPTSIFTPPIQGTGLIQVFDSYPVKQNIQPKFKAYIQSFDHQKTPILTGIPATVSFDLEPNYLYRFKGEVKRSLSQKIQVKIFQAQKVEKIIPRKIPALKIAMQEKIQTVIRNQKVQSFLTGILTGEQEDLALKQEMNRFGLQHIMAISGFHFSLIALFCSFFLNIFLPQKKASFISLFLLTLYFFMVGYSPSVLRALIFIFLFLVGSLIGKKTHSLNSLGVALIVILCIDTQAIFSLGCQFSFLITASILLFFQPIQKKLEKYFPKRPLKEVLLLSLKNQIYYLILRLFIFSFSLSIAVNLTSFLLILYHFHTFYLLSLVYNLFFPYLISFSLFLFFVALFIPQLFSFVEIYTQGLLNLLFFTPKLLDYQIFYKGLSSHFLILFFSMLFFLSLHISSKNKSSWTF